MEELILDIPMMPDVTSLSEVTVVAVARRDTEAAMIEEEKKSNVVQTGDRCFVATNRQDAGQRCFGSYKKSAGHFDY